MASLYVYANELNPKLYRKAIRVRLIRTYLSKEFGSNEKSQNRECLCHDFEGTCVHVQIPCEFVEKHKDRLKEGKVYSFKNFDVHTNRVRFKTTDTKYMIKFNCYTDVVDFKGEDFPKHMFRLKDFAQLKATGGVVPNQLYDLIGRVVTINHPKCIQANGSPTRVIDFVIENTLESRLLVTAWDDHVDSILPYYNVHFDEPVIVILQLCRARVDDDGEVKISTSYNATKLLFNMDCPEFSTFRNSMPKYYTPLRSISSASRLSASSSVGDLSISSIKTTSLKEIYDSEQIGEFYVAGEIVSVQTAGEWFFVACKGKSCGRKLYPSKGLMHCKNYDKSWQEGIIRYRLTMTIMDDGDQDAPLLLWDRDCNSLLGMSAAELKAKYEGSDEVPNEIQDLRGMTMVFRIIANKDHWKRENSPFIVKEVIRDENVVKTHCAKLLDSGDNTVIKKLSEEVEFKEKLEEGLDSARDAIGSEVDLVEIVDSEQKPMKRKLLLDEFAGSQGFKEVKIEKE